MYVSLDHTDYIIDIHLQELLNTYAMRMLISTQQKRDGYFNLAKVISVAAE